MIVVSSSSQDSSSAVEQGFQQAVKGRDHFCVWFCVVKMKALSQSSGSLPPVSPAGKPSHATSQVELQTTQV